MNIENLSHLSDNELMQQFHAGMSTLYGFMELIDNGAAINKDECRELTEYVDRLTSEILKRECNPNDLKQAKEMLKLDLN